MSQYLPATWALDETCGSVGVLSLGDPPPNPALRLLLLLGRRVYLQTYLSTYRAGAPQVIDQARAFFPLMAAARLIEEIAPEREKLLGMVEKRMGQ